MEPIQPNSHKYKEEREKRATKVVNSTVRTREKNKLSKITDAFVSDDADNVGSYIIMDVIIPAVKKLISDVIKDGIDMFLFGEKRRDNRRGSNIVYTNYSSYSSRDNRRVDTYRTRDRFDFDELVFDNRGEAELVRDRMEELIDRYGLVTVADMYDMADVSAPYTSNKYGWTSIRRSEIRRLRDGGYVIDLPRPSPID